LVVKEIELRETLGFQLRENLEFVLLNPTFVLETNSKTGLKVLKALSQTFLKKLSLFPSLIIP